MDPAEAAAGAMPVPDGAAAAAAAPVAPPAEAPAQQEPAGEGAAVKPDPQPVEPAVEAPAAGEEAPPPPPPPPPPAAAEPAGEAEVKAEEAPAAPEEAAPAPPAEAAKEEAAGGVMDETAEAAVKAEPPSDEALVARLRQLLAEIDLATTTEKQLRRKLEAEYGCDLADRKALLRAEINAYLQAEEGEGEEEAAEEEGEEEGEEAEEATSGRKRGRGGGSGTSLGSFLSPEMQEFLGEERLPRTQVVKRLWAYIKENELQDPKDKRVIIFDEKLQKLFPGTRSNMFKLQKLLSKHCKTSDVVGGDEDDEEEGEEESEGEAPAPKKRRASSGAARSSGGRRSSSAAGGERKPGGFQKECQLSEEMAAWIGKPAASRPEITKFFWAYCKERELQDPSDKSFILADDTLKALTGEERFKGFGFAKLIKQHLS
ncbi:Upstream activation factor subunit spp27 [Chlorella sorokiniana]|uniref:Upstream activation factor subunit spp27 n=1 Tax=Chlorella sorokiniana TaxID=3076 RepID=A0A2P6U2Q1_CHLSO|nr:Upstream activation factor subunit spp27 [Chlorella sorokiniana]|eukprot:PRW60595.1 Upstream activation factor subunit spp27 [Chlorella sorokiniana]